MTSNFSSSRTPRAVGRHQDLPCRLRGHGTFDQSAVSSVPKIGSEHQLEKVGDLDAEIVQGTYVVYPGGTTAEWNPKAPIIRLRWIEDGIWFEMAKFGNVESISWLDKAGLIALAESLVQYP